MPDVLPDWLISLYLFLALILIYGLLRRRILHATHGFRVEAGQDAIRLSRKNGLDEEIGRNLRVLVYAAYRPLTPWILLIGLLASLVPTRLAPPDAHSSGPAIGRDAIQLRTKLFFALISTSPFAFLLAAPILTVALAVRSSLKDEGSLQPVEDCISRAESLSEWMLAHSGAAGAVAKPSASLD